LPLMFERFYLSLQQRKPLALSLGNLRAGLGPFDQQHAIGEAANFIQAEAAGDRALDLLHLGNSRLLEGSVTIIGSRGGKQPMLIIVTNRAYADASGSCQCADLQQGEGRGQCWTHELNDITAA